MNASHVLFSMSLFHFLQASPGLSHSTVLLTFVPRLHALFHLNPSAEAEVFKSMRSVGNWENYSLYVVSFG